VIDYLIGAAVIEVGGCLIVAQPHVAADVQHREALLVFAQRAPAWTTHVEAIDAERGDRKIRVGAGAKNRYVSEIKSKAYFIEQRRGEGVDVLSREAAIRESAIEEEIRVQLVIWEVAARTDIVHEDLVVLTEVLIDASDALIG